MTKIDPNNYIIFDADGIPNVKVLMDATPPQLIGGGAKYENVDRRRRPGLTIYTGRDPVQQKLSILFDANDTTPDPVQAMINLDRMWRPPPRMIKLIGPVFRKDIDAWVITDITWGTNVMREIQPHGGSKRTRQDAVVTVSEYITPDHVEKYGNKRGPSMRKMPRPKFTHYVVRRGDTLSKISLKMYKNAKYWKEIQKANHIRDPKKLKVGQNLRMP